MVSKGHQWGDKLEDDRGVYKVNFLPHGVRDPSGPGAEEGEDLERANLISSLVRGVPEGFFFRCPLLGRGSLGGKN